MTCAATWTMTKTTRLFAALLWFVSLLSLLPGWAWAVDCRDIRFEDTPFTVCSVDPAQEDLRLFLYRRDGLPLASFGNVSDLLAKTGQHLTFAMNGGMYHADRAPVGLYVENGARVAPLITKGSPGNFGMLPNGVLCLFDTRAEVIETRRFAKTRPTCKFATQSGPMLVIDGALHPRFLPGSTSRYIRNGVGVSRDGQVHFAISNVAVNFHLFARLFRDRLKTPQALYFDGNISRLYAPSLGRSDAGFPMGPIIGVVK